MPNSTMHRTPGRRAAQRVGNAPVLRPAEDRTSPLLHLQRTAGNRAIGQIIQRTPAGAAVAETSTQRQRAARLGAPDAVAAAVAQFPALAHAFTAERLAGPQKVIDETVINPDADHRATDLDQGAVNAVHDARGVTMVVTDERRHRQAEAARAEKLHSTAADDDVRLGGDELLPDDLLQIDNPIDEDEQQIIVDLFQAIAANGVWLSLDHAAGPAFSLKMGKNGHALPDFTRAGLRAFARLPRAVGDGPISGALEVELHRLRNAIESGRSEHFDTSRDRDHTTFGVVELSDLAGGADFPSQDIWNLPYTMLMTSETILSSRNTSFATSLTAITAQMTADAAKRLTEYQEDTVKGAERVVRVLRVLETAGHVAQAALAVVDGVAIIKAGASLGSKAIGGFIESRAARAAAERAVVRETVDSTANVAETTAAREARKQLARERAAADAKRNAEAIERHRSGEASGPVGEDHQGLIKDTYQESGPLAERPMTEEEELASVRHVKQGGPSVNAKIRLHGAKGGSSR